jgi:hypothetical protein
LFKENKRKKRIRRRKKKLREPKSEKHYSSNLKSTRCLKRHRQKPKSKLKKLKKFKSPKAHPPNEVTRDQFRKSNEKRRLEEAEVESEMTGTVGGNDHLTSTEAEVDVAEIGKINMMRDEDTKSIEKEVLPPVPKTHHTHLRRWIESSDY